MKVFQLDLDGVFLYEQELDRKPHNSVLIPPPEGSGARVWISDVHVNSKEFGENDTGRWEIKDDNRKEKLYSEEGEYTIGKEVKGEIYNGLGDIPDWLSKEPRPSEFHYLEDGEWVEDEESSLKSREVTERMWRDQAISNVEWLRNRHNDEIAMGVNTTLSEEQFLEVLSYMQTLRDYPESPDFPSESSRPTGPEWVKGEL